MKMKIWFGCIVGILLMGVLTGCGGAKETALVNTVSFDTEDLQSLHLDYDADDIRVLEGQDDTVVLKEYMNEDNEDYYAKTTTQDGELRITEGNRPRSSDFKSYIEIYIPSSYHDSLYLHSTSGTIKSVIALELSGAFSVETTSGMINVTQVKAAVINITSTNGTLNFSDLAADKIKITTTNADTVIDQASGIITYQAKGGNLTASDISGAGSFGASGEGSIAVFFAEVTGDVTAYAKNGKLSLTLPQQLAFNFNAATKNGSIETPFDDLLTLTKSTAAGTVGVSPTVAITLETRNGEIKVTQ